MVEDSVVVVAADLAAAAVEVDFLETMVDQAAVAFRVSPDLIDTVVLIPAVDRRIHTPMHGVAGEAVVMIIPGRMLQAAPLAHRAPVVRLKGDMAESLQAGVEILPSPRLVAKRIQETGKVLSLPDLWVEPSAELQVVSMVGMVPLIGIRPLLAIATVPWATIPV